MHFKDYAPKEVLDFAKHLATLPGATQIDETLVYAVPLENFHSVEDIVNMLQRDWGYERMSNKEINSVLSSAVGDNFEYYYRSSTGPKYFYFKNGAPYQKQLEICNKLREEDERMQMAQEDTKDTKESMPEPTHICPQNFRFDEATVSCETLIAKALEARAHAATETAEPSQAPRL